MQNGSSEKTIHPISNGNEQEINGSMNNYQRTIHQSQDRYNPFDPNEQNKMKEEVTITYDNDKKEKKENGMVENNINNINSINNINDNSNNIENGAPNSISNSMANAILNSEIINFENEIKKEMENVPLVDEKKETSILTDEYKNNADYFNSVLAITKKYKYIRKIKRDGNCFYRAFIYRLFEHISINQDKVLYEKILKKIQESKDLTTNNGFDWIAVEDFYTTFLESFQQIFELKNDYEIRQMLMIYFADREKGNYLIYFIRFCIAAYLRLNKELYEFYIEGAFENWIVNEVTAIDHEADQIQIMAVVNYFDIGVKIEYLNKERGEVMKFPEDKKDEDFFITVLFTPGHYDVLYEENSE